MSHLFPGKKLLVNPIKTFLLVMLLSTEFACVERYYLESQVKPEYKVVVDALITSQSENQQIKLSRTSSPEIYGIEPLSDCVVMVIDSIGNEFLFNENPVSLGLYEGIIDKQFLENGTKLMLYFITGNGDQYVSEFEELLPCPPVDSVYFEIKRFPTNDPGIFEDGIQFYIDLNGKGYDSRYFRWQLDETWEYHSIWPIRDYYDENNVYHNSIANYSYFTCYKTFGVDKVFTINTEGLNQNIYIKYSLHFVNDHTQRLLYRYSLMVKQYSLSESAYYFWENLKKNNQESGGLFDSQPSIVKGNVHNLNNSNEVVLGFFGLSSVQTKRINVGKITEFSFNDVPTCSVMHVPPPDSRPLYLIEDGWGENECFDCRILGGSTELPDFWKD